MKNLILMSALFLSQSTFSDTLTGASLLNKISQSVRGQAADISDLKILNNLPTEVEKNKFIEQKTDQYLTTKEYTNKTTFRLMELFQYKTVTGLKSVTKDASTQFFDQMTIGNLSWDTLLTGKKYKLSVGLKTGNQIFSDPRPSDFGFYGILFPLPSSDNGYIKNIDQIDIPNVQTSLDVVFPQTESQIAGAVTTPLFFERYGTTGLNKNRSRAAAIFRIFLCDKMKASIPVENKVDDMTYDILYPNDQSQIGVNKSMGMTQEEITKILNKSDEIHGTRKDCMTCHSKLDPMGKVFANSGSLLSSIPTSGRLYYKNSTGQIIDQPVDNLNQMGQLLTQQDDYVTCQIKQFWNWYIGEDQVIDSNKLNQLKTEFNRVDRKTNDFVKSLVFSSDFAERR
jgi:hypothetical protein